MVKVGLINNRHPMPVVCAVYGVELTLMHYDRDTDEYVPQVIFSKNRWRI